MPLFTMTWYHFHACPTIRHIWDTSVQFQRFRTSIVPVALCMCLFAYFKQKKMSETKNKIALKKKPQKKSKAKKYSKNMSDDNVFYWHQLFASFLGQDVMRSDFKWSWLTIFVVAIDVSALIICFLTSLVFDGNLSVEAGAISKMILKVSTQNLYWNVFTILYRIVCYKIWPPNVFSNRFPSNYFFRWPPVRNSSKR